jgi:hypothetical protein
MKMKFAFRRYICAVSLVLALPLLALGAVVLVTSDSGDNGIFDWFTVGPKGDSNIEHTIAYGINSYGATVGTYEEALGAEHGFATIDEGKHIYAFDYPGACATDGGAINDKFVIAGTFEKWTGPGPCGGTRVDDFAFEYEYGKFEKLNVPTTATFTTSLAICTADGGTYLPTTPTTGSCTVIVAGIDVRGINYDEDIVGGFTPPAGGDLGFTFSEYGEFRVLEVCNDPAISATPEGCTPGTTDGWGVNDHYVVVGHYEDLVPSAPILDEGVWETENHHHGFIWTKNGTRGAFTKLYCDGDPLTNTDANGINNYGVIVGRCDSQAFVLLPPYRNVDWHKFSIPDPASGQFRCPTGWELNKTIAWGISNNGKVTGQYVCESTSGDKSYSFEVGPGT